MRQFDSGRSVTTERGPQPEDHSAGLIEGDLIVRLLGTRPAKRLVKGAGAGQVPDAERHHGDALFHLPSMAWRESLPASGLIAVAVAARAPASGAVAGLPGLLRLNG